MLIHLHCYLVLLLESANTSLVRCCKEWFRQTHEMYQRWNQEKMSIMFLLHDAVNECYWYHDGHIKVQQLWRQFLKWVIQIWKWNVWVLSAFGKIPVPSKITQNYKDQFNIFLAEYAFYTQIEAKQVMPSWRTLLLIWWIKQWMDTILKWYIYLIDNEILCHYDCFIVVHKYG